MTKPVTFDALADDMDSLGVFWFDLVKLPPEHDVEVVITDLRMPNMSGLDLIRTLRARHPTLPIIAASSMADGRSEEALQAGTHTFLAKPFSEEKLQGALHEALPAAGEAAAQ